jgi:hypothetical protein
MKKLFLTTVLALSAFVLFAQNLDKIKDLYKAKKLEEARTQIDQFLAVEKNKKTPTAGITRRRFITIFHLMRN